MHSEVNWMKFYFFLITAFNCISSAASAKSLQSCLTLCNPIDGSPPGSSVPGILQARLLEWVAIAFSSISSNSPLREAPYLSVTSVY